MKNYILREFNLPLMWRRKTFWSIALNLKLLVDRDDFGSIGRWFRFKRGWCNIVQVYKSDKNLTVSMHLK